MRSAVDRRGLGELVRESVRKVAAMTPEHRAAMLDAQRRSWVRGEIGMGSDAAEAAYRAAYRKGDKQEMARLEADSAERIKRSGL